MSKPATLSEICKALDPDNKRYSLDHYPPQVKKSPPVKVPPLIPEFVTLWAGISITWCLAEGFDRLAIFLPSIFLLIALIPLLSILGIVFDIRDTDDLLQRVSLPVWRKDTLRHIPFRIPDEVIRAYANEGYRDLAKTYVSNMIDISNDDMLDMPQRSELRAVCDKKFEEALSRCREIRRESMETYMQTWKDRVDNYNV